MASVRFTPGSQGMSQEREGRTVFSVKSGLSVEHSLSELYGYRHVVLFGGARSGLRAVVEAIGMVNQPILIPSNVCSAVLAAIVATKARAVAVPVSATCGMVSLHDFLEAASAESEQGILMPTHLYGVHHPYEMIRESGWFILENDTLCTATIRNGQRRAVGDALLVSFNHVKTIEAGGGGAVLTDDTALAKELTRIAGGWRPATAYDRQREEHLMLARRHLRGLGRLPLSEALIDLDLGMTALALNPLDRPAIESAIVETPAILAGKQDRLNHWMQKLAPLGDAFLPMPHEIDVPWRLTLALQDAAQTPKIVAALREAGFDAGTNYPPLAHEFPSYLPRQAEADLWGSRVLNLWLTERYDKTQISSAVDVMRRHFDA